MASVEYDSELKYFPLLRSVVALSKNSRAFVSGSGWTPSSFARLTAYPCMLLAISASSRAARLTSSSSTIGPLVKR